MVVVLTGINLVFNMLWSVLFFAMKKPLWAMVEVSGLWLSIAAMMVGFYSIDTLSALLLIPYIAWVSVAALLNLSIIRLNPAG